MTLSEARGHFLNITKKYFAGATVDYANRSSSVKPESPYVCLTPGTPVRDQFPVERIVDERLVRYYQTRLPIQVDLFTNGKEGQPDENGFVRMEDTAVEDLMDFLDYLESHYVLHWCDRIDASITVNGGVQPLSGVLTDTDFQYRAMVELTFSFVHKAVGHAGVLGEGSIRHPGETGPGTPSQPGETPPPEEPGVSPSQPQGDGSEPGYVVPDDTGADVEVKPAYQPTPSGGRSEELVNTETGYFSEVDIKYKKEESNP